MLSSLATNYTNILSIYGGGGKLFGGNFLFHFYFGMMLGKYYEKVVFKKWQAILFFIMMLSMTIGWWLFVSVDRCQIDKYFPFGEGFNPPSVSLGIYGIFWGMTMGALGKVIEGKNNFKLLNFMAFVGQHTLYIFLYHRLFLDFIIPKFKLITGWSLNNFWLKRVIWFGIMILGSICIEFFIKKIYKYVVDAYKMKYN